ncbi:MAG: Gfo/Idh/MocA family oxidoreductase [Dehalococcoidia bacterium]
MDRNIAVVGCGYWGKNLTRNFAELGALHTVCDSSPEALRSVEPLYPNINTEASFEAVLADNEIKGVVISTPAAIHFSMASRALLAGKDVFVEKPLSLEVREGEELVRSAEEKGRILMVGHVLEYHPAIVRLKELVDGGDLGKIDYIYSSRLNFGKFRTEENILWSFAPHDISVLLLMVGELPLGVSAHGGCYLHQDIADVTVTTMNFASGVRGHVFVSWLHPYKEQKLVVVGDRKMAVFDDVIPENKLLIYEHHVDSIDWTQAPRRLEATPVEFASAEPLRVECQHFIECLESRCRPRTDGRSALRVLQVLDACQRSLQSQGENITMEGRDSIFVHPSSLVEQPSAVGEGTRIWHFSHVMPRSTIGKNCTLGQNVFIGENAHIGDSVSIQNNVSVFGGVTLEDNVFCGPSCVFTNIKSPRSGLSQRGRFVPTLAKEGATIGANATIMCGSTIGKHAFVGAGSVVTSDVPDYALAYGNPARIRGWVCSCGTKLDFGNSGRATCSQCAMEYAKQETAGEVRVEATGP